MNDKVWLVCESVTPYEAVSERLSYGQVVLAMEKVLNALDFLHTKALVSHNNLSLSCIFVHYDESLSNIATFKLGGFDCCSESPSLNSVVSKFPDPPEGNSVKGLPIHSRDVWHLGHLFPKMVEGRKENKAAAMNNMCKAMKNAKPELRPNVRSILSLPFFRKDSFLTVFSFLSTFRAKSAEDKISFFDNLDFYLGGIAEKDLKETVIPLLLQNDVFVDGEGELFWSRLFADYQKVEASKGEKLECGILRKSFIDYVIPSVLDCLKSEDRSKRFYFLKYRLNSMLPVLPRSIVAEVVISKLSECMKDCDRALCIMAMNACVHLCKFWVQKKDQTSLSLVNAVFIPQLQLLSLDSDVAVRERSLDCLADLFIFYSKIDGISAVKILVKALFDCEDKVKLAALAAIDKLKKLFPSVIIVPYLLPNLVRLLLAKNEKIRHKASSLIVYLSKAVEKGRDIKDWPDMAVPEHSNFSKRAALLHGSIVADHSSTSMNISIIDVSGGPNMKVPRQSQVIRERTKDQEEQKGKDKEEEEEKEEKEEEEDEGRRSFKDKNQKKRAQEEEEEEEDDDDEGQEESRWDDWGRGSIEERKSLPHSFAESEPYIPPVSKQNREELLRNTSPSVLPTAKSPAASSPPSEKEGGGEEEEEKEEEEKRKEPPLFVAPTQRNEQLKSQFNLPSVKCGACGKQNPVISKFCKGCGNLIGETSVSPPTSGRRNSTLMKDLVKELQPSEDLYKMPRKKSLPFANSDDILTRRPISPKNSSPVKDAMPGRKASVSEIHDFLPPKNDLIDLLKAKGSEKKEEEEEEAIVPFGGFAPSDEDEDEDGVVLDSSSMLDLVLQTNKNRETIISGAVTDVIPIAEKKKDVIAENVIAEDFTREKTATSSKFEVQDLDGGGWGGWDEENMDNDKEEEQEEGGGWGDDDIALPLN